jgi:5-methyltetrahydrofolate--homocysteine methyltransferase
MLLQLVARNCDGGIVMDPIEQMRSLVIHGEWEIAPASAQSALDSGFTAHDILDAMVSGMDTVGAEWHVGNMFIPEVLLAAKALHAGLDVIKPLLSSKETKMRGSVVIGTVKGDLHDIGKSLVALMIEGSNFQVHDLGVDVSPEDFVAAVKLHKPNIVAMSALLTTTLPYMRDVIRSLEEAGLRDQVKIMVGGAPVTPKFADSIGADGYAPDGATAVTKARELMDGANIEN